MAFEPKTQRTPTALGDVAATVTQSADGTIQATFEVQILDQNGDVMEVERGNLLDIADAESQATFAAEAASLRTKAGALLPA